MLTTASLLDGYQEEVETMVVGVAGVSPWQQEVEESRGNSMSSCSLSNHLPTEENKHGVESRPLHGTLNMVICKTTNCKANIHST